jgi:hypothetical protein
MLVDRKGRPVSALDGPSTAFGAKPLTRLPDFGDWRWADWHWDARALNWLPSWRNAKLQAWACEGTGYWRVTGRGRAYGTGDTFAEAWGAMVQREFAAEDARKPKGRKPRRTAPVPVWAR